MTSGGKILLGLLALGGITLAVFHSGEAHADSLPPPNPEPPNPLPNPLPTLPSLPGNVLPPPGTPIPIPGGGSIPTPTIPGVNTPTTPTTPTTPPPVVPLPPSSSPFPAVPAPGSTVVIPGVGPVVVPTLPAAQLPPLIVTPGPAPAPSAPPASPAELPGSAPADTLALVSSMLKTEQLPHWRISDPLLKAWQGSRGRTQDGNFGTGDALAMAKEIGTIPIIRAWPKGSFPGDGKLDAYRASLQQIANAAPEPRASQLRLSAARETGQGYGTPETPIAHLITIQ